MKCNILEALARKYTTEKDKYFYGAADPRRPESGAVAVSP